MHSFVHSFIHEWFCFCILKLSEKVLDINDLSGTVSPLEKDEEETKEEEENEEGAKTKKAEAAKRFVGVLILFLENSYCAQTTRSIS